MKSRFIFLIPVLILGVTSCESILPAIENTPTPPVPSVNELTFEDPATEEDFKSLNQCVSDLVKEDWRTTSYQYIGNFYESRWCTGSGARDDCQIALSSQDARNQQVIDLYTLSYPDTPTEMFGVGIQTLWVPDTTGWSASFYFSEKGKTIIGEGWGINFNQYTTTSGPPAALVTLGFRYSYKADQTEINVSTTLPIRDELTIYLQSPESMHDRGVEQLLALENKTVNALETHQITTCDYAEYQGNGIPPVCTPRPMTAEEETSEIDKAHDYFNSQIRLLNENYQEIYAAWMKSFPMNSCWQ